MRHKMRRSLAIGVDFRGRLVCGSVLVTAMTLATASIVMAQEIDQPLPFEAFSLSRWEIADAWPEGPARAAWAYYVKPVTGLPSFAGELDPWLIGPRYRSLFEANQQRTQFDRSIDFFCRSALVPMAACAIRLDRLSRFYEELSSMDPFHATSWRDELAALATRELASLEHPYGRYQTFLDDPGSTIVIDQAIGDDGPLLGDIEEAEVYFRENQRRFIEEQKKRWRGWETVWFAWREYNRDPRPSQVHGSGDMAEIWADLLDGISRVVHANQAIVRLNADSAGFALDRDGCGRIGRRQLLEWTMHGLVDPERISDCLNWTDAKSKRLAMELHESFTSFRQPANLDAYIAFCAEVLGEGDVQPVHWEGINTRWRLANEIRDAEKDDEAEVSDRVEPEAQDVAQWAIGGLVLTALPDPDRTWPWLRRQVGHDEDLESVIRLHFQDQRDRVREHEETLLAEWYRKDYRPDEPQSGELLLACLEEGERASDRFIDRLWGEYPQGVEAVKTCLLAFEIERSRRTAGLSLSGGRYRRLVPRFFTGLLASGVDDEQVLALASREVRLLSAKSRAHKRMILKEFNRLRILLLQVEQRGDETAQLAAEARQTLASRAGDLVEDLWSGVDRIARALPEPDRRKYMAWIIDDLGGDWTGNPATRCREVAAAFLGKDTERMAHFVAIEAQITEVEARIIRTGARGAVADEKSRRRIARDYHALRDKRYRLLDELAAALRAARDGAAAEDLPGEWQLVELICAEPRETWRYLQQSIDRVIRVSSGKGEQ